MDSLSATEQFQELPHSIPPVSIPQFFLGDMVTFTSVPSADGRFNNIKGKVLIAVGTTPTGTGTTSTPPKPEPVRNPHYQFPISPTDSQRSILRQNALTNARELVTWLYGEDDASITIDYVHDIITIARKFEEYTSGDMDIAIAKEQIRKMEAANNMFRLGDAVRRKGVRGRPRRWTVTDASPDELGCVIVTNVLGETKTVKLEDLTEYPSRKELEGPDLVRRT